MKTLLYTSIALAASLAAIAPAQAQSLSNGFNDPRVDSRLQIGVTIPFGGQKGDDYRQPRLEIASVRRSGTELDYNFRPDRQREIRRSIAFTLEDNPQFLVNGRFAEDNDGRRNISTGAAIAIGVGAAVILTAIVLADQIDDAEDGIRDAFDSI